MRGPAAVLHAPLQLMQCCDWRGVSGTVLQLRQAARRGQQTLVSQQVGRRAMQLRTSVLPLPTLPILATLTTLLTLPTLPTPLSTLPTLLTLPTKLPTLPTPLLTLHLALART